MDNRVLLVLLLRHDDRSKPTMAETGFMGVTRLLQLPNQFHV